MIAVVCKQTPMGVSRGVPETKNGVPNNFQKIWWDVPSMFYEHGIGYFFGSLGPIFHPYNILDTSLK